MRASVRWRGILRTVASHAAFGLIVLAGSSDITRGAEPETGASILQQLRNLANTGSVLYVAAHPDDENTQVITYLARGRGYRTAYLSLTRGDGGQNLLGPQLGEDPPFQRLNLLGGEGQRALRTSSSHRRPPRLHGGAKW